MLALQAYIGKYILYVPFPVFDPIGSAILSALTTRLTAPPSLSLEEIGASITFIPAPTGQSGDVTPESAGLAGLTLTGVMVDQDHPDRALAIFADGSRSLVVGPGESVRPGVLLASVDAEGATLEQDGLRSRSPLKKSVPPAEAYITAISAEPTPTPTPMKAEHLITDNPDGIIVRTIWPPQTES